MLLVIAFSTRLMLVPTPCTIYATPAFTGSVVAFAGIVNPESANITVIPLRNVVPSYVNSFLPRTSFSKFNGA